LFPGISGEFRHRPSPLAAAPSCTAAGSILTPTALSQDRRVDPFTWVTGCRGVPRGDFDPMARVEPIWRAALAIFVVLVEAAERLQPSRLSWRASSARRKDRSHRREGERELRAVDAKQPRTVGEGTIERAIEVRGRGDRKLAGRAVTALELVKFDHPRLEVLFLGMHESVIDAVEVGL
jgi:hypothetical protein